MNSAINFQDQHERIWIDDFGPFVFAQIKSLAAASEMKNANVKAIEAIRHQAKKFKFVFSILDTTETESLTYDKLMDYYQQSLIRQFKAGLEYTAFLRPRNEYSAEVLAMAVKAFTLRSSIGVHETFESALHHTTQLWQARLSRAVL